MPDPAAVLAAFGIGGRVLAMRPVPGAWSNRVYRLRATTGTFAVKELRNPWADAGWRDWLGAAWEFEQLVLASGVAMPQPVPDPASGGPLAWVEAAGQGTAVPVRVHRWSSGTAPGPGPVSAEVAAWAGQTLARLHGLAVRPADRSLFPGPVVSTATADRWPELAELARRASVPWAGQVLAVMPVVAQIVVLARSSAPRPGAEVMTHGDVDQKNIVITGSGPVLCDWDLAMPMVPRRELADVAMSLAARAQEAIAREVVRAYRAAGGDAAERAVQDLGPQDLGQTAMAGLDWIEFNISRAVGARPGTPAEVARSAGLVPGLLANLPGQVRAALRAAEILRC